ncbi:lectin subunit alpha-like [Haematobia irritans]|uniref:lectin subunit alpha-like n=1 Tax=Haematobia irritans TaxID=7368 RepID=UPI003F508655
MMVFLKLVLATVLIGLAIAEPQWYNSTNDKHYLIEGEAKYNWFRAKHECSRRDLQLVEIQSEAENQDLIQLLRKVFGTSTSLWLGANDQFNADMNTKRPFYWTTSGKTMTFSYWHQGEPNNERNQEHCVHTFSFNPDFRWNDVSCSNQYGFICEEKNGHIEYRSSLKEKREQVVKIMKKFSESLQHEDEKLLEIVHQTRSLITRNNNDVETFLEMVYNKPSNWHDYNEGETEKDITNRESESRFTPETNHVISELSEKLVRSSEKVYQKLSQQFQEVQRTIEEVLKNNSE